jgi:hypothetical protein
MRWEINYRAATDVILVCLPLGNFLLYTYAPNMKISHLCVISHLHPTKLFLFFLQTFFCLFVNILVLFL